MPVTPVIRPQSVPARERGTVLVVALVLLLVLTLLGVSTMNMTRIEERMAANSQEMTRAFQAAESGLSAAFADPDAFNLTTNVTDHTELLDAGEYSAGANYTTRYVGSSSPPVGSLYSATTFNAYHFDTQSTAFSSAEDTGGAELDEGANAAMLVLVGGAYQIGPKL